MLRERKALERIAAPSPLACRWCTGSNEGHEDDCPAAIASEALASEPESVEPIPHPVDWAQYHEALADGRIPEDPLPESASVGEGDWSEEAKCRVAVFLRDYHFIAKGQDKRTDMPPALVWWSDAEELLTLLATHAKPPKFRRTLVCAACAMEDDEPIGCDSPDCDGAGRFITADTEGET